MKLTNELLMNSVEALKELCNKDLDAETAFKLQENLLLMNEKMAPVQAVRDNIIKMHHTKDKDGQPIYPFGDQRVQLTDKGAEELNKLMKIEQEIPFEKLKVSLFAGQKLKTSMLIALNWLIER